MRFGMEIARMNADAQPHHVTPLLRQIVEYVRRAERARIEGASHGGWQAVEVAERVMVDLAQRLNATVLVDTAERTVALAFGGGQVGVPLEWPVFVAPPAPPMKPMEFFRPGVSA
jgi:hypothetical protein